MTKNEKNKKILLNGFTGELILIMIIPFYSRFNEKFHRKAKRHCHYSKCRLPERRSHHKDQRGDHKDQRGDQCYKRCHIS